MLFLVHFRHFTLELDSMSDLEKLKEEAKSLGYRLSKIPEKKEPVERVKKTKRAMYLTDAARPQFRIEEDVDPKEVDRDDDSFVTCSEPEIRVLSKLFMQQHEQDQESE